MVSEVIKKLPDGNKIMRTPQGTKAVYSPDGKWLWAIPETIEEIEEKERQRVLEAFEKLGIVDAIKAEIRAAINEVMQELNIERKGPATIENEPMEKIDWFDQIPG